MGPEADRLFSDNEMEKRTIISSLDPSRTFFADAIAHAGELIPERCHASAPLPKVGPVLSQAGVWSSHLSQQPIRLGHRLAEMVYEYKTLVEEGTGHILGAHLVGPNVDEVINIFGLAIRHGLTAEQLKTTTFAYPTGASDVGYML